MANGADRLEQGDTAPDFTLQDENDSPVSLTDFQGQKVILYFYPADDTPGCTAEACDFRDARQELADEGYVVLGVSPQGQSSHDAFARKHGLNFPLLVDDARKAGKAYGVVIGDGARPRYSRSTFVIDEQGKILEALYGVTARGHVASLRELLEVPAVR